MQQNYDTREIRQAAARLSDLAGRAEQIRRRDLPEITREADALRGETARAIEAQAESLGLNVRDIVNQLNSCSNALYAFARKLDEADQAASGAIRNS